MKGRQESNRIEVAVYYVEEQRREQEGIYFRGAVLKELVNLVDESENEILILGTTLTCNVVKKRIK